MGMPETTVNDLPATATGLTPAIDKAPGTVVVRLGFGLAVMVVVGLVTWLITATLGTATAPPPVAVNGLGIFAVFFVAALAVERLIEPITLLDRKKPELEKTAKETHKAAVTAANDPQASDAQGTLEDAAADASAAAEVWATYRAIALWGLASLVGALAAALLNLHLLKTAGIQTPSLYLEILATGLIIGAGTKPLHELNKLVAAKAPSGGK